MGMDNKEMHQLNSIIKISINSIISVVVIAVLLLLQWFVLEDATTQFQTGAVYWISKAITGIATYMLMISIANIVEESKKRKDKDYNKKLDGIDSHYKQVHEGGEVTNLDKFLDNLNKQTKYSTYISIVKKKIRKQQKKKRKNKELIEELEQKLLLSMDEVWEEIDVKYSKVTDTLLFSGAIDVAQSQADENDLHEHRMRENLLKLFWKFVFLFAFGIMTGDLVYSFNDFTKGDIIPLLIKIFTILWCCYCGCTFGFTLFNNSIIVLRKKLRILSIFRSMQDKGDKEFKLEPVADLMVDRAKAKFSNENSNNEKKIEQVSKKETNTTENATQQAQDSLKQTWNETFGAGVPVKPNTFAVDLAKNIIKNNIDKNLGELEK